MSIVDIRNRVMPNCTVCSSIEESDDLSGRTHQTIAREIRFERTVSYINGLNFPVDIIDRMGGILRLPDGATGVVDSTRDLIVYVSYRFVKFPKFDPFNLMNEEYVSGRREIKLLRDFINRQKDGRRVTNGTIHVTIKYTIKQGDFNKYGESIYFKDLDTVLSIADDPRNVPAHPFSNEGIAIRNNKEVEHFKHHITINDPRDEYGHRYINISGKAYRIPVIRDPLMDPGVYIEGTVPAEEQYHSAMLATPTKTTSMERVQTRYYNWADADKLGIFYHDQATAETVGDPHSIFKREVEAQKNQWIADNAKRDQELARQAQELKEKEQQYKELELSHKAALADKERELKDAEMKYKEKYMGMDHKARLEKQAMDDETNVRSKIMMEDKYNMEKRKNENSTVLDLLKWVPAAIIATAGVAMTVMKFMKPAAALALFLL